MNIIKTANNYKILLINNKFDVLPLDVINELIPI